MLLGKLVPNTSPTVILESLAQSDIPVEEQYREFTRQTGLSRRTFFKCRKQMEMLSPLAKE